MSDQTILKRILSNTEEVKEVVVSRENEKREKTEKRRKKRKEKQKESHAKFTQIKANVNEELLNKIKSRSAKGNISGYILKLIDEDTNRTPSMFDVEDANSSTINKIEAENKELKAELQKLRCMNIRQKLFWLFLQGKMGK